jgi:hypothetical protein
VFVILDAMYTYDSFLTASARLRAEWHSVAHGSTRVQASYTRGVAAVEIIVAVLTVEVLIVAVVAAVLATTAPRVAVAAVPDNISWLTR